MSTKKERDLRQAACHAQRGLCIHCHRRMNKPTVEHLIAKRDGGKSTRANIAAACWGCNHARHADRRYSGLSASEFGWVRMLEAEAGLLA